MMTTVNTVVVGGGQAGLSVSHYLRQLSIDHVVLEQADKPGEACGITAGTPSRSTRRDGSRDCRGFVTARMIQTALCRGRKSWRV
jgi:cation diffusion facilitator CzcD-associated flavoprotein CzcO